MNEKPIHPTSKIEMRCVLGIDGGGTKTVCVLMNEAGTILGRGEAGPSNYQSIGIEAAGDSIKKAIAGATASVPEVPVMGIGLGLAGVGRPEDVRVVRDWVERLQGSGDVPVRWCLQPDGVVVTHDCAIALVGGTGHNRGVAIIAGTGSIAYGCNGSGVSRRAGGWGYLLGDEGSGYDIAIQGLRAAVRSHDGRSQATLLTRYFIDRLELQGLEDLVEVIYRRGWGVKQIAALAPIIDEAAVAGDAVANQILDRAVRELVSTTRAVSSVLFDTDEVFEIVTIGGVWRSVGKMRDRFDEAMVACSAGARVIWPRHEPAYGAGLFVLNQLSVVK